MLTLEEEELMVIEDLKSLIVTKQIQIIDENSIPKEIQTILAKYEKYTEETKKGLHGKTAKFWYGYVEMMQIYHQFIRSIRVGDLEIYISMLPKLTSLFFTFNRHNYARWLVIYHDNLLNLKETHPQVHQDFKAGCFALKRTSKQFSRIPIDLTLEQTINADTACQRSGISALTNFCKATVG